MSLSAVGPCLRIKGIATVIPDAAMSRMSKCLHFLPSSMLSPTSRMILRTPLKLTKRRVQTYAFSSTSLVQTVATLETHGQQAEVDATDAPSSIPSTSSTSSLTWKPSSVTSTIPESGIRSAPTTTAEIIPAAGDLSDTAYKERSNLLLSKRSLIEGAARVDHERKEGSTSTFKVPTDEIFALLRMRRPKRQEEEPSEKVKNSLTQQAGRAIRDEKLCGVVVSAGKMDRTVTVRFPRRDWSRKVKRHYCKPFNRLVHDPANAVRLGDVVSVALAPQGAQQNLGNSVFHVVDKIVVPFGVPLEERPPVMSMVDLAIKWTIKTEAKLERRKKRREESKKAEKQVAESTEPKSGEDEGE